MWWGFPHAKSLPTRILLPANGGSSWTRMTHPINVLVVSEEGRLMLYLVGDRFLVSLAVVGPNCVQVIVNVDHSMSIMREESFGPLIGIQVLLQSAFSSCKACLPSYDEHQRGMIHVGQTAERADKIPCCTHARGRLFMATPRQWN